MNVDVPELTSSLAIYGEQALVSVVKVDGEHHYSCSLYRYIWHCAVGLLCLLFNTTHESWHFVDNPME